MPQYNPFSRKSDETIDFSQSGNLLSDLLLDANLPFDVGTFEDFTFNVFAKSFPNYKFNSWYQHKICSIVDKVLAKPTNRYLLAALPRGHLKSTLIGYSGTIYSMLTGFGDGLYLSVKTELADYHLSNIKSAVRNNDLLSSVLYDLRPESDSGIHYRLGSKRMRMYGEGILSAQRGRHFDFLAVVDDVLGDVANPLVLTELDKAKRLFESEVIPTLNPGCPLFVYGTVMAETDLLFDLRKNPLFEVIWYPAIDPDPEHDVLWPERFNRQALEDTKSIVGWKSFSTEYLLVPLSSTEAFFTRDMLDPCIKKELKSFQVPGW